VSEVLCDAQEAIAFGVLMLNLMAPYLWNYYMFIMEEYRVCNDIRVSKRQIFNASYLNHKCIL